MLRTVPRLALLVVVSLPTAVVRAELKPAEIAIVAARGNRESEGLAKYYSKVRNVPEDQIILVDVPKGEVCSHKDWTWAVRPEIQKWIHDNDPGAKIRCLVTTWGVPLKIGPAAVDAERRRYKTYLEGERAARLKLLEDSFGQLNDIAPGLSDDASQQTQAAIDAAADAAQGDAQGKNADGPADATALASPGAELAKLQTRLETALRGAQQRLAKIPAGADRQGGQQRLQQLVATAGGVNVILQGLQTQIAATPKPEPQLLGTAQSLRGVLAAWSEARALIEQQPPGIQRDALVMGVLERIGGQLAVIAWIDEQLANIDRNETGASFDSELALVMWPDDYQLLRWQPNYLREAYEGSQLREAYRTLMVSRIDAPTLKLAKGLIDTAIAVEKEGLQGKAYFDARGLAKLDSPNVQPGSYPDYDRALLLVAKGIDDQTNIAVTLNEKPELFQPGDCPDAALYCGWYSLAKYIDAFTWKPGAVAYHLASSECVTLHDPETRQWCANLLNRGVCATIGPVYEPYLVSFPRPEEFFARLLQGKMTLVECYWRTQPFTSWMQVLIGDPLYTPFKNNPALSNVIAPVAPADADPAAAIPPAGESAADGDPASNPAE